MLFMSVFNLFLPGRSFYSKAHEFKVFISWTCNRVYSLDLFQTPASGGESAAPQASAPPSPPSPLHSTFQY